MLLKTMNDQSQGYRVSPCVPFEYIQVQYSMKAIYIGIQILVRAENEKDVHFFY